MMHLMMIQSNATDSAKVTKFAYHNLGEPIISFNQYNPANHRGEIVNARPDIITEPQGVPTAPVSSELSLCLLLLILTAFL